MSCWVLTLVELALTGSGLTLALRWCLDCIALDWVGVALDWNCIGLDLHWIGVGIGLHWIVDRRRIGIALHFLLMDSLYHSLLVHTTIDGTNDVAFINTLLLR